MPTLTNTYNWGTALKNENPVLARQLSDAYSGTALIVNGKCSKYVVENEDPPSSVTSAQINKNFEIGDIWIRTNTNTAWIMTSRTTDLLATWTQIT